MVQAGLPSQHPPLPRPPPPPPVGGMSLVSPGTGASHQRMPTTHHPQQNGMPLAHPPSSRGYPSIPPPPSPNNLNQSSYHHPPPPHRGHYPQHGAPHPSQTQQVPPLPPPNMNGYAPHGHGPLPPPPMQHGGPLGPPTGSGGSVKGSQHGHHSQHQRRESHQSSSRPPNGMYSSHHGHDMRSSAAAQSQIAPDYKDDQVFLNSGLNGDWQSDKDMDHRRQMIQHIVKLLKQRDRNQSPEWLSKLPQMVKQLEVSLYRSAPSFEAYSDITTLKHRLQLLAMEIARKTQQPGDKNSRDEQSTRSSHDRQDRNSHFSSPPHGPLNSSSSRMSSSRGQSQDNRNSSHRHPLDQRPPSSRSSHDGRKRTDEYGSYRGTDSSRQGLDPISNSILDCLGDSPDQMMNGRSSFSNSFSDNRGNKVDSRDKSHSSFESDPRLKIKQQRLVMLYHSSKCDAEEGQCKTSIYCAEMKRLWKHMVRCQSNNCTVPHCFSSRTILAHYKKCTDKNCYACAPVREAVRKSAGSKGQAHHRDRNDFSRNQSSQMKHPPLGSSFDSGTPSLQAQAQSFSPEPFGPNGAHISSSRNKQLMSNSNPGANTYSKNSKMPSHSSYDPRSHDRRASYENKYDPRDPSFCQPVNPSNYPSSNTTSSGSKIDYQNKMKHKQQRLLLLRHASKCPYEEGKCPDVPYCATMKRLWAHIANCNNYKCEVQHCISSRYILSHYRKCKDTNCPACAPVREAIKRSHEKDSSQSQRDRDGRGQAPRSSNVDGLSSQNMRVTSPLLNENSGPPDAPPSKRLKRSNDHQADLGIHDLSVSSLKSDPTIDNILSSTSPSFDNQKSSNVKVENETDENNRKTPAQPVISDTSRQPQEQISSSKSIKRNSSMQQKDSKQGRKAERVSSSAANAESSKPVENHSLINCFTTAQIQTHIQSLNRTFQLPPSKLKSKCSEVLKGLQTHQHGWVFNAPVDPVALALPDYFDIIKRPMDLGTIQKRLETCAYHSIEDFASDVHLTFDNAMTYNQEGSVVHNMANELKNRFITDYEKLLHLLKEEDIEKRKNDRACTLCGCEKLLFEPPVYFCTGLNCQSKRIRRNSHYYVGSAQGSNQYYWCNQCYNELDPNSQIELLDSGKIKKADLKKKKNDEVHEESWVQCDTCERWIHQICGLFNARQNKEHKSEYMCPLCSLAKRKKQGEAITDIQKPLSAADLPRTSLSERLEKHVRRKVNVKLESLIEEKAVSDKINKEDAKSFIRIGGDITIRQVTSTDRKLEVRERMKKRYAHKNYPDEFPFRCKCIVVFQNLDGVDVILFALYVYEHGDDNPSPNKRTVYISYLDSVHFLRPRRLRTLIYHEILISYLDYAREKGFAKAHIWACPPLKGDDYIFYCKPEDQKTPKDARLRQWYIDMLVECQRRNIVGRVTNMYDLYFADEKLDATAVPYLEGDYFPGEAEHVIKEVEEGKCKDNSNGKKSKKKRNSSKINGNKSKKGNANGNGNISSRSNSIAVEDDVDNSQDCAKEEAKSYRDGGRDTVMIKLGEIIKPMKESFLVAFLNWEGATEEDKAVPQKILDYRKNLLNDPDDTVNNDGIERTLVISSSETSTNLKIIDDDKEELDCEFLNNRQAFLNLCRGNHYQFDELRRAKHSSMMVLWHLHNRDAPKFVQQCISCSREILTGMRYHCRKCPEYDLCAECYNNPNTNRGGCTHKLEAIPVEASENSKEMMGNNGGLTEEQRKERQRNIQLHIQLIEHASQCVSSKCNSSNCAKMKGFLKHGEECKVKAAGGCKICRRIWTLLRIHAQHCKNSSCKVPNCISIRERFRQLAKQQQAMDDRRRLEMNRACRAGLTENR